MTRKNGWTHQAIDCYYKKSCDNCLIADICLNLPRNNSYNLPPMKFLLLSLVKEFGVPERLPSEELNLYE